MKYYKVTLNKDLPTVKAGFTIYLNENQLKHPWQYMFSAPGHEYYEKESKEYNINVQEVLRYKDIPEYIKVEPDLNKAVQIKCPSCDKVGMFDYITEEYYEFDGDIDRYYRDAGLICAHCNNKIKTHKIYTGYKIKC